MRLAIDDDHQHGTPSGHVSLRRSEGACGGGRGGEDVTKSRGQELHAYENLEAYLVTFWDTLRLYSATFPRLALSCLLSHLSPACIFPSSPYCSLRHQIPSPSVQQLLPSQCSPATFSRLYFPSMSSSPPLYFRLFALVPLFSDFLPWVRGLTRTKSQRATRGRRSRDHYGYQQTGAYVPSRCRITDSVLGKVRLTSRTLYT